MGLAKKFVWIFLYHITEKQEQTFWPIQHLKGLAWLTFSVSPFCSPEDAGKAQLLERFCFAGHGDNSSRCKITSISKLPSLTQPLWPSAALNVHTTFEYLILQCGIFFLLPFLHFDGYAYLI